MSSGTDSVYRTTELDDEALRERAGTAETPGRPPRPPEGTERQHGGDHPGQVGERDVRPETVVKARPEVQILI
jgi:hypothetical protein